jgi:hypothetical protein
VVFVSRVRRIIVLARREILNELRRIGIKEVSLLIEYLEDFDHYCEINYGLRIATARAESKKILSK